MFRYIYQEANKNHVLKYLKHNFRTHEPHKAMAPSLLEYVI